MGRKFRHFETRNGCPVITVTENSTKLWSITLTWGMDLDKQSKDAVFYELAQKYRKLMTKKEKIDFLDEVEEVILPKLSLPIMHRKSLIRKLKNIVSEKPPGLPRGRRPKYNDFDKHHLTLLWKLTGFPCSKRLKSLLPEWLEFYDCAESIKLRLREISPSQMDVLLQPARHQLQRKISSGTVPAKGHIRKKIRLRDPSIRHEAPGYVESDTVLHCGDHIWGYYAHTVSTTDLLSGWTLGEAIRAKTAENVVRALKSIQLKLPFAMIALFFDNGIEYINHLLVEEFKDNQEVDVARGRVGRSNDQCHIEQKNSTFVRNIFGNVRIEDPTLIPLMNEIYDVWGKLHNYFMPQMKLISKDKVGSKTRKKYDKPKTPYQRLMESHHVNQEVKDRLTKEKSKLNPFELQSELQEKLVLFHKLNNAYNEKISQGGS